MRTIEPPAPKFWNFTSMSYFASHLSFLAMLAVCFYFARSTAQPPGVGYYSLAFLYPFLLVAYLPLFVKACKASTPVSLVRNTDLAGTHEVIHEVFYKDVPYLNPFFPFFIFATRISKQRSQEAGTLQLLTLLGRRMHDVKYFVGLVLLGWVYFIYLTSNDNVVSAQFVSVLGAELGAATFSALLALLQFTLIFDLLLTVFFRFKQRGAL